MRISHTSWASQRPNWGKLLTRFADWVEHTSVAQRFQRVCFCLYLYLAKLSSWNLYMILLSLVMLLFNSVFPPIQQSRYIDVSISEFQKTFENLRFTWCFFYHVMEMLTEATANRELKKAYDRFISKHNTHDLHDLYFRKGNLNTNEH